MNDHCPMKLLVVTMLYEPDCVGIAAIASDMCAALAERGHDVTVYTAYPYYPEWKRKSEDGPWRIRTEVRRGVAVRRHGLYVPSHPSRLVPRVLHELSFPLSLLRSLITRRRFDAVMVYCPLLGSVMFAVVRKWLYREPLWVNIQDIPTEAGRNVGINRSRFFHAAASAVQSFLFNRARVWSTISEGMAEQLDPVRRPGRELVLCPNWLTGSLARHVASLKPKSGKLPGKPLKLMYSGTIGKKQGLLEFCRHLAAFDIDFRFRIRGDGGEAAAVREWVDARSDRRFDFGGLLPEDEFVQSLHETDLFVITERQGAGFSFLPSKLIPSISVGTPVLAIADSDGPLGREITQHGVGTLLEWNELDQLPQRIAALCGDQQAWGQLQRRCYERARDFHRDRAIDRIEDHLCMLTGRVAASMEERPAGPIVYVAPDCTDRAVTKRAHGFLESGHDMTCFSFRRERYLPEYEPDWPNIELGRSEERRLMARAWSCVRAIRVIFAHRRIWRKATLIYARNLDLALLAVVGRFIVWSRAKLAYEVLDIHPAVLSTGLKGKVARWLERRILRRCSELVVSSPAFLERYFEPVQGYSGPSFVLENKWPRAGVFRERNFAAPISSGSPPVWTIGWFGNIRCEKSLHILTSLADALPDRVRIYLRGHASYLGASRSGESRLAQAVAGRPNIEFAGAYDAPDDLPAIYRQVHFNWCADFSGGPNGRWLIPNRIYEGGFFGVPALAIEGHYTGELVKERGLGIALADPYVESLKRLLLEITDDGYERLRRRIEERPIEEFVDTGDLDRMIRHALSTDS